MNKYILIVFFSFFSFKCEDKEVEDTTPPAVTITSPQNGSVVSDSIEITCMSTDNDGIANVELWVNGISTGITDSTEPYSLNWITSDIEDGIYTIIVRAYDLSDNATDSSPIFLTVSYPDNYHLFSATFNGEFDSDATSSKSAASTKILVILIPQYSE